MKIAVTGAHGLTSGALVQILNERGHDVIGIVRREGPVRGARAVVVTDLDATPCSALAGVDVLVHVAGIHLGERLSEAEWIHRVSHVVVVSTAGIYSKHRSSTAIYARNEQALRRARTDMTIVRPTMIYGSQRDRNVHRVVEFARRWRFLPVPGTGSALIQPIHFRDLALALAALAERPSSGTIDAGGGDAISMLEAAREVMAVLGMRKRIVHVPLRAARAAAWMLDLGRSGRWRERVERTLEDRIADNARLVAATGVVPRRFRDGLMEMIAAGRG